MITMDFDWKSLVKTVAPWIGTALGGPMGGMAVTAISSALGVSQPTEDNLKQAMAGATPDDLLKLKQADQDFQEKMQALGFTHLEDMATIAAGDRNSARLRQMAVKDKTPSILAYVLVAASIGLVATVVTGHALGIKDPGTAALVGSMIGGLQAEVKQALAYMYGVVTGGPDDTQAPPAGGGQ
jgi:hypothetical protein